MSFQSILNGQFDNPLSTHRLHITFFFFEVIYTFKNIQKDLGEVFAVKPVKFDWPAELCVHVVLCDPESVCHVPEGQAPVGLQQLNIKYIGGD